ncbi:MAG: glycosyltransferase family 2 protein [Tepidisphaeraceae bacterium]|jgi:GT2 family glycosyltransferase
MSEAAVLIVCFNGREFLGDCLASVFNSSDAGLNVHVIVIDSASTDGSAEIVRRDFPQADLLVLPSNVGYAAANNFGWKFARNKYPNLDYLAILNHDTLVQSGWLAKLAGHLETHPRTAAAQPKILLWPKTDRFNTAGNESHYLGFGIVSAYDKIDDGSLDEVRPIDFPSGAAVLLRAAAVKEAGLFDDLFFLYLEDADLGWKLRQMGFLIEYVPAAVVWHKYAFQRNYEYYYFLERNRWILLATYYKLPTMIVLSPMLILMELGQLFFAWRNGVLGQKIRSWRYFWCSRNLAHLRERRRESQQRRKISDRQFTRNFVGEIDFSEIKSRTLRRVGNPLLNIYWQIARRLIVW